MPPREGWDTPQPVRDAIVNEVVIGALNPETPRLTLAAVRCAIDMVWRLRRLSAMSGHLVEHQPPHREIAILGGL